MKLWHINICLWVTVLSITLSPPFHFFGISVCTTVLLHAFCQFVTPSVSLLENFSHRLSSCFSLLFYFGQTSQEGRPCAFAEVLTNKIRAPLQDDTLVLLAFSSPGNICSPTRSSQISSGLCPHKTAYCFFAHSGRTNTADSEKTVNCTAQSWCPSFLSPAQSIYNYLPSNCQFFPNTIIGFLLYISEF